jgi:hypothetical protein
MALSLIGENFAFALRQVNRVAFRIISSLINIHPIAWSIRDTPSTMA